MATISINLGGAVFNYTVDPADLQRPYVGLLRWEEMTYDAPWEVDGITFSDDGSGTTSDKVSIPASLNPGSTYRLTYDMTRASGSVALRAQGDGTNITTLNATATGATVSLVIPSGASEGANLELRSGTFSGDITPISLVKASV